MTTKLIEKNTTIPTKAIADVLDGGRQPDGRHDPRAAGRARPRRATTSRSGRFDLTRHSAGAARHAAGRGHVRHRRERHPERARPKDKATGKEQKIVIKASSGLERRTRSSAWSATPRRTPKRTAKFRELADTRNQADALVHATEKALEDLGDKVSGEERAKVESALGDLQGVLEGRRQGRDRDQGTRAGRGVGRDRAAGLQASQPGGGDAGRRQLGRVRRGAAPVARASDEVLDAEFEEVKDKDREGSS